MIEHALFQQRHLVRLDSLAAGDGAGLDVDHHVVELATLDFEAFAFGHDGVAEEVGGIERRFRGSGSVG